MAKAHRELITIEYIDNTGQEFVKHQITEHEADEITKYKRWCPSCKEYTTFDPETGKCLGIWDCTCDEVIEL